MKKFLPLLLLCGCAVNRQVAETTTTNPVNGEVVHQTARTTQWTFWDAWTKSDKVRASAGKTASVGATGTDEGGSSTNIASNISALTQLLNALK